MLKGVRIYKGYSHHRVYINGKQISWKRSLEYIRIGYTGFDWGYGGAGPQQLAFAILLELTNEKVAYALCTSFTKEFVEKLPRTNFAVPLKNVLKAIEKAAKHPIDPLYKPHKEKYKERYQS